MECVDYLLVGQGVAGTVLGYSLISRGYSVKIIDEKRSVTSSLVAAGLFNPITGRKRNKTWLCDELFNFLPSFYKEMEKTLKADFYHPMDLYFPYEDIQSKNELIAKTASPSIASYIKETINESYKNILKQYEGGFVVTRSGWIDVPAMLNAFHCLLTEKDAFSEEKFETAFLRFEEGHVVYKNIKASKVIFCKGRHEAADSFFDYLPFTLAKGEVLEIEIPDLPETLILNKGVFILPLGNHRFKVGSSFIWCNPEDSDEPSEKGLAEIYEKLEGLINLPYKVISIKAAIRPTVRDRKPMMGLHPDNQLVGIFNGLGSKGVSIAPYFADHYIDFLEGKNALMQEVDIHRFLKFYHKN